MRAKSRRPVYSAVWPEIVNNSDHVLTLWTNQYKIVMYTDESGGYKFCAAPKLALRAAPQKQSQYGG